MNTNEDSQIDYLVRNLVKKIEQNDYKIHNLSSGEVDSNFKDLKCISEYLNKKLPFSFHADVFANEDALKVFTILFEFYLDKFKSLEL